MNSLLTKSSKKIAAAQQIKEGIYWKKKLSGSLEKVCFPLDLLKKNEMGQYNSIRYRMPDKLFHLVEKLSGQNDHALNIILVSGLALLLHKYTGSDDIILGQPVSKQSEKDESINDILILRLFLEEEMTFKEVLNQARQTYVEAVEHQNYPMDILSEELGIKPKEMENAFFDIGIQLKNIHGESFAIKIPTKVLFSFQVIESSIILDIRYDAGLFLNISIERIVTHYFSLLEQVVDTPEIKLNEFHMFTKEDKEILLKVNNTTASFPMTVKINEIFEAQVKRTPNAPALIGDKGTLTYAELNNRANRLARVLRDKGIGPDTIVAIMAERSTQMMVGIVAILKAGGAYLPIDPNYPKARIEYILHDSGTKILLTQNKFIGSVEYSNQIIILDNEQSYSHNGDNLEHIGGATDLAYVIYTSGSTGKPKGAMIEHRSAINRINWMQKAYPIGEKDVILQKTPISFDVSVWELFWWMFEGASVCMLKVDGEKDPDAIISAVENYHVTTMHFVPSMLNVFLDYVHSLKQEERLKSLKQVFASGEALTVSQVNLFNLLLNKREGAKLINLYGPTEATVDVSHFPCSEQEHCEKVTIGKPIDNIRLYVVDSKLRPQPVGVPGELCIAGIGLARGYLNRSELTKEKFVENPFEGESRIYRTGDLARWDANGNIEYLGRIDHQVKIRGFRIELGEIEDQLRKNESVKDAAVIAREGVNAGKYLCAYIIPNKEISKEGLKEALKETLAQVLPEYMVPSIYCFLDAFPLSPNGKLDRKALPEPSVQIMSREYIAPRNETEQILTEIWTEVLKLDRVSVNDDFFSLGGSSIHFISVLSKARVKGLNFTFQEFYKYPTIEKLVKNVKVLEKDQGKVQKQKFEPFELLSEEDFGKLPEDVEDAYPLSLLQAGLIFQSEISKGTAFYHDIVSYMITGPFYSEFEQAVKIIVEKHPIFRTSYHLAGYSEYIQMVHKEVSLPLYITDLRGLTAKEQEECFESFLVKERAYGFKWEEPGLIRFHIQILSDTQYRYNLSHHNSTIDGWSTSLIHTELFSAYYALMEGKEYKVIKVDNHLRNHIGLEKESIGSVEDQEFWRKILSEHNFIQLPRWKETPDSLLPDVCIVDFPLPTGLSEKIIDLANNLSVPVKNVLMAAHMRVLSVLSSSRDVNTGYEHSGRPELEDADKAVGIFLNTIPFRIRLTGGSWEDLIWQVYQAEIELLPHRRYPMAKMKQDLATQEPLFETAFNFTHFFLLKNLKNLENFDMKEDGGESVTEFVFRTEVSQNPYTDEVILNFHYHRNVFETEQIERIAGYFIKTLQCMVENRKGQYLLDSILTDEEVVLQTEGFNSMNAFRRLEMSEDIIQDIMSNLSNEDMISFDITDPNMNIYILDENLLPVPIGSKGEIYISSKNISKGDTNDNVAKIYTVDPFKKDQGKEIIMIQTGCIGRWLWNGILEYLGQKNEQIRVKGFEVNIDRIEDQILEFEGIEQVAVITREEERGDKRLAALMVSDNDISVNDMIKFLKGNLPDYMIPSYFAMVEEIALTNEGKIDRSRLDEMTEHLEFLEEEYLAPNTELEKKISQIWSQVLGISEHEIGLNDNFFNLGGNSLSAISLVVKSEGLISLKDIMKYPILGHLVEVISNGSQRDSSDGMLVELSEAVKDSEKEFNIICFPYGAGNAITYMPLSKALLSHNRNIGVYGVELPGHNISNLDEEKIGIKEAAKVVLEEIKEKENIPVILYGHCAGCALALEVARLMKEQGLEPKYIFLGGILIRGVDYLEEHIELMKTAANEDIKDWLFSLGGNTQIYEMKPEQSDFLVDAFKHDGSEESKYYKSAYCGFEKLEVPIVYIVADDDDVTADYMEFYQNFNMFSDNVSLKLIEGGGHYFINTRGEELANVILEVWKGQHESSF